MKAEEARKKAMTVAQETLESRLNQVLVDIEIAANQGNTHINIYNLPHAVGLLVYQKLLQLGYRAEAYTNKEDNDYIKVSWRA